MKNILTLLLTLSFTTLYSQDLSVPDSIVNELETKSIIIERDTLKFKIKYPENYSSDTKYPVYLALSGGNQSDFIVDYCYYAWFRSDYFKDYITIMPIDGKKGIRSYNEDKIERIISAIKTNFNTTKKNWILGGTSNGGASAFNFREVHPKLYVAIIVMPGSKGENNFKKGIKKITFILAYGEKDEGWAEKTKKDYDYFIEKRGSCRLFEMKGQGHLLTSDYNIDEVYKLYFD